MSVIDGDTIRVSIDDVEESIRLIGVDTPETVHPSKPVEAFGKEASDYTKSLLTGESVWLRPDQGDVLHRDKYGRVLAYVYRAKDRLFVNAEIVKGGYGHAYTVYPFRYMQEFRALERIAREAGRGLWSNTTGPPSADTANAAAAKDVVYVTRTGRKYHRAGCRYLAKSQIELALPAAAARYGPCSVCNPPTLESAPKAEPQSRLLSPEPSSVRDVAPSSSGGTVKVRGYYRKDGTYVRPHTRRAPSR